MLNIGLGELLVVLLVAYLVVGPKDLREVDDAAAQADLSGVAEEVSSDLNDKKD